MKKIAFIVSTLSLLTFSYGETLEDKVNQLQQKVQQLEERLNKLEGKQAQIESKPLKQREPILLDESKPPVIYTFVDKKFHKPEDVLVERFETIKFTFKITSNFKKDVDTIYGKMVVYDKNGNEILSKPIKIAKPLDIFTPMKIRPGETFTKVISIEYESEKPSLRYLKDAKNEDIKVELIFDKVEFSDGSVEFLNY